MCDLCEDLPVLELAESTPERWVAAGVELLDRLRPGWDSRVDLATLNVADGDRCVLGQVFGSYSYGLDILDVDAPTQYGFNAWENEYGQLTREWRDAITARRRATINR